MKACSPAAVLIVISLIALLVGKTKDGFSNSQNLLNSKDSTIDSGRFFAAINSDKWLRIHFSLNFLVFSIPHCSNLACFSSSEFSGL